MCTLQEVKRVAMHVHNEGNAAGYASQLLIVDTNCVALFTDALC